MSPPSNNFGKQGVPFWSRNAIPGVPVKALGDFLRGIVGFDTKPGPITSAAELPVFQSSENPPQELDGSKLEECYKYGLFAKCAYANSVEEAGEFLKRLPLPCGTNLILNGLVKEKNIKLLKYNNHLVPTVNTDTEVVAAKMMTHQGAELVLAFRGTETTLDKGLVADAITDIYFVKDRLTDMEGLHNRPQLKNCEVHSGFLTSFNGVIRGAKGQAPLMEVVQKLFPNGEQPARVVVCGHSLGGALCTLAAFWAKAVGFPQVELKCFAFAAPRVGNPQFCKLFNELVPDCYRFTHKDDVVPSVPFARWGFGHVARSVLLLEPEKDHYGVAAGLKPQQTEQGPTRTYIALLAERPIHLYTSAADHSMDLYLGAIANVLGLHKQPLAQRVLMKMSSSLRHLKRAESCSNTAVIEKAASMQEMERAATAASGGIPDPEADFDVLLDAAAAAGALADEGGVADPPAPAVAA